MTSRHRDQKSKRERSKTYRAQRGLFDSCPATREAIAALDLVGCPLCGHGPEEHEPEAVIAGSVPDDAPFADWMLNLPRGQA